MLAYERKHLHDLLDKCVFTMKEMEKVLIERSYIRNEGNKTHTALELGLSIRTVRYKIKKYKLEDAHAKETEAENLERH